MIFRCRQITLSITLALVTAFLLTGCGGGGGGSATIPSVTSVAYNGTNQIKTYSTGAQQSFVPVSSVIAWATDHVTSTTTYTYADGATNPVVATVPGTAGTPTYNGNTQTIVTTYGDGTTSTANNTATSSPVTWASDHVTKTTTYTFANGGTNPVVATVNPTTSNPTLTAANYPANWTTTGTVTPPSVSNSVVTYGDGYSFTQDGTLNKPFWQSTLLRNSVSDPSAFVYTATTEYDLRWGTPDKDGPHLSADFSDGAVNSITLNAPVTMWGQTLSGQCALGPVFGFCLNGPTIGTPHTEVLAAWRQGWTGKGVSIMMEDSLFSAHGATTALLANRYAIASTIYGYNFPTNLGVYNFDGTTAAPTSMVNLGVVNMSYGANLSYYVGHAGPWTDAELAAAATAYSSNAQGHVNRITGVVHWSNFNYTSAVIVKSAGNDTITADKEPLVKALANAPSINSRLLVVGAITMAGFTNAPATISSYSNTAGTDTAVASRFLVASGTTPFNTGDIALNGVPIDATTSVDPNGVNLGNVGTSYAAPRVAGYVAIVRSKFPNLDAIKVSSIMLDTARYDTLTCNPNCDPAIYGKGEASLSRALAPVGRLR